MGVAMVGLAVGPEVVTPTDTMIAKVITQVVMQELETILETIPTGMNLLVLESEVAFSPVLITADLIPDLFLLFHFNV